MRQNIPRVIMGLPCDDGTTATQIIGDVRHALASRQNPCFLPEDLKKARANHCRFEATTPPEEVNPSPRNPSGR
jgi:hypothetical protein